MLLEKWWGSRTRIALARNLASRLWEVAACRKHRMLTKAERRRVDDAKDRLLSAREAVADARAELVLLEEVLGIDLSEILE